MRFGFLIDNRRCIGCHACTVACKSEHDVPLGVNRTWVKQVESGTFPDVTRSFHVLRCNHCTNAPCVEICPVSALFIRPDGIVDFDNGRCIGCKGCLQACPYDALHIDPRHGTAAKCNFCTHRVDRGLQPACVVACPEQAIVAGDLTDPQSFLAQLVAEQPVQVRKPERGTGPALYYIEGQAAALDPLAATAGRCAAADASPRPLAALGVVGALGDARVSYDTPKPPPPWGWHVSGYLVTKALAAGLLLLPLLGTLVLGLAVPARLLLACGLVSLLFQGATAALLVGDLQRPDRFLNVLLRGNPRSWLVRGAWILTALGAASTLWLVGEWQGWGVRLPAGWAALLLAPLAAVYTAFLLAQAKGRELWQSRLQPVHMLLHAVLAGAAGVLLLATPGEAPELVALAARALAFGLPLDLGLALLEVAWPHGSPAARLAARHLHRGQSAPFFWGLVVLGSALAAVLVALLDAHAAGAIVALLVLVARNDLWVRAGQAVPLS